MLFLLRFFLLVVYVILGRLENLGSSSIYKPCQPSKLERH